jgi:YbbR domain-containing protein
MVILPESASESFTKDAIVKVFDANLNKLNVIVEPQTVKVMVPIKNSSKKVPIDVVQKGSPPSGISVNSISLDTTEATITGSEDVLKSTDHVRVEVDLSNITDDTTLTIPVIISNGITKVSPEQVKATIKVNKGGKSVSGIPIKMQGLPPQYKALLKDPDSQTVNLIVFGSSDQLNTVTADSFSAYVDLTNLSEGDHNVKVQVDGPSDVKWNIDKPTALITISKASA